MTIVRSATETEKGQIMADQISRFVNCMCNDEPEKEAAERLASDHRTLQQNTMRFFMKYVAIQAEQHKAGRFDGRNEGTVELCAKIMELQHCLPFI